MRLVNLKTDLKSLRYGNDRFNGGSSGQPFITTPIPDDYIGSRPDFLLRQGALDTTPVNVRGVTIPVPTDAVRITRFLDSTEGQLFIVKQTALERLNPAIPGGLTRIYNPLNTIAQVGNVPLGFHLNKQGETGLVLSYAQGGQEGYFVYTLNKNLEENVSRLSLLYDTKITSTANIEGRRGPLLREFDISGDSNYSLSYNGGPDSIGGVGRTRIKLSGAAGDPRNRTNTYKLNSEGITNNVYTYDAAALDLQDGRNLGFTNETTKIISLSKNRNTLLSNIVDYRKVINNINPKANLPSTPYKTFNREDTYGTSKTNYYANRASGSNYSISPDVINALNPSTSSEAEDVNGDSINLKNKDLISFYFEILDPSIQESGLQTNYLFFRAYINDLGDSYKADWQNYKYVGRAENFYKYGGFNRDVSLGFTIYAHSRAEMIPLYKKLNLLVGSTAPKYSGKGFMMGTILKITVGNYFNNVPGVLTSISLKPSFEAGWDINRADDGTLFSSIDETLNVGQLPRMIDVTMNFTPIHNFTPEYRKPFINTPPPELSSPTPSPLQRPTTQLIVPSSPRSELSPFIPPLPRPTTGNISLQPGAVEIPLSS